MHNRIILTKLLLFLLLLSFTLLKSETTEIPEIFVQTGHTDGAYSFAVSQDGKYLVSSGKNNKKIWEISEGRELRTLKINGRVTNFLDNERFIIINGKKLAEIYNVNGEKLKTFTFPKIENNGKISITKNLKYFYVDDGSSGVSIYDIEDGSEIKFPEKTDDSDCSNLTNLGYDYFGIFFSNTEEVKLGETGYVIYDENLTIKKKGIIKGRVHHDLLKVDAALKYIYENRYYMDNPLLLRYDLNNGAVINSVPGKQCKKFSVLQNNSVVLNRDSFTEKGEKAWEWISNIELSIYDFMQNGIYKQKTLFFENVNTFESLVITNEGQVIVSHKNANIILYDKISGEVEREFGMKPIVFRDQAYANGRLLDIEKSFNYVGTQLKIYYNYNIWNLSTADLEIFNFYNSTYKIYKNKDYNWIYKDPDEFYKKIPQEFFKESFKESEFYYDAISPLIYLKHYKSELFYFKEEINHIQVQDKVNKTEVAKFYAFSDGEWIVITPEGYFNASTNGAKYINVRIGNKVYSIDNFYEKYYNPAYVASVLQGKKVEPVSDIRQGVALPPEIRIISPESNSEVRNEEIIIKISAKDMGGGIDEIRLYHNGKVVSEETRGIKIVPKGNESTKSYTITLVDGLNMFRAVGFSRDRTESNPSEIIIKLLAPEKDVSLSVLVVGINKYKNPALNLNYANPDAKSIADFFRNNDNGLFKSTRVIEVYDTQATKEGILAKLKQLESTNPQDAVLIYLAGHGENINDKWYFIPHELTYPEREENVKKKAISSDELATAIKNIKAQKILVLIDACKSGAVLLAFRGFEDRKALSQLSRSTGVHIVAASSKDQFATEVKELGHGVFTYTLLEGLNGKASGIGETVTVRKLMSYIEEQLPEITKKYRQEVQYPVVDSKGMDFPITRGK